MHRAVDLAAAYCTLHGALALRLDGRFSPSGGGTLFSFFHFRHLFPAPTSFLLDCRVFTSHS
jgi:hypothetical protein